MNRIIAVFIFSFLFIGLNAQKLDLIVTSNNDSVACKIDSVGSELVYFTARRANLPLSSFIKLEEVVSYDYEVISKGKIRATPGTIYFRTKGEYLKNEEMKERGVNPEEIGPRSMYNIRKNTIAIEFLPSLVYNRVIPMDHKSAVSITAGVNIFGPIALGTVLLGNCNHSFEGGVGGLVYWFGDTGIGDSPFSPLVRAGYRYTSRKGFHFRAFGNLSFYYGDPIPLPFLSFGYSF